jgi:hypothetical protein
LYKRFDDPVKVRRFLSELARDMHLIAVKGIDQGPAVEVLGQIYAGNHTEQLRDRFQNIEPNSGLIVLENGQYRFWHLSFQEFLTATALADRARGDMFGPIEQFWDDPWYSEVVQLYVGFLSLNQMGAANEIVERVLTADDQKPFNKWRLAAKAFENIHKDRREADVLALAQKRLLYVMHSDAEPKHRAEAGETLGWLGDPRDLKEFIPVTGGEYNLSLGKCMIEPFELGKYPVTNGWFREFVEAGGYKTGRYWTGRGRNGWRIRGRNIRVFGVIGNGIVGLDHCFGQCANRNGYSRLQPGLACSRGIHSPAGPAGDKSPAYKLNRPEGR